MTPARCSQSTIHSGTAPAVPGNRQLPTALDAIEIWNGRVGPQAEAVRLWDRLLAVRQACHGRRRERLAPRSRIRSTRPAVRVFAADLTERHVLAAISNGHVIVMRSARDAPPVCRCAMRREAKPPLETSLTCASGDAVTVNVSMPGSPDARVDLVWNGDTIASKPVTAAAFTLPAGSGYARVHVVAPDGATIAITNPVYVKRSN